MEDPSPFGDLAGELYESRSAPKPRYVRDATITLRVAASQKELLRRLAEYVNQPPSTLAGSLFMLALESFVLGLLEKPTTDEERRELIQQLREGGVEVDDFDDTVTFRRDVS